jgi:hypothetical protein
MNSQQRRPKVRFADSHAAISIIRLVSSIRPDHPATSSAGTFCRNFCRDLLPASSAGIIGRDHPPVETGGWNFGKSAFADCTRPPLLRAPIHTEAGAAASRRLRGFS